MKHSQKPPWGNVPRCPRSYRPRLETLEDRLPPGDTVLGGLLTQFFLEPDLNVLQEALRHNALAHGSNQPSHSSKLMPMASSAGFSEEPGTVSSTESKTSANAAKYGNAQSTASFPQRSEVVGAGAFDVLHGLVAARRASILPNRGALAGEVHRSNPPGALTTMLSSSTHQVVSQTFAMDGPGGFGSMRHTAHVPGISTPSTITLDSQLTGRQGSNGKCSHTPEQYQTIVTNMRERLEGARVPGGSIAIVCNGQLDFAAGVGVKDYQEKDPVTPDTLFRAASLTKMLTGITALSLVDEGKLDLHRPITDYLPWFEVRPPYAASSITTHDLLTHRAGLPAPAWLRGPTGPGALEDYFREASPMTLWAPPGRYFNYSNVGFCLAGLVAETIDGRPYDDVVQARVLDRAGMKTATFDPEVAEAGDFATGHDMTPDGRVTQTYRPTSYDAGMAHPAGGAFASVRDYAHLAEVLLDDGRGMLTPKSNRALQSPQVWSGFLTPETYYGYGLFPDKYKGMDIVWHRGGIAGFATYFVMVPETKDAVVIFTNAFGSSLGRIDALGQSALDTLYGLEKVPPTDYRTPPATWTAYEGTYYDPTRWGEIRVELRDDRLWFHFVDVDWSGSTTQNLNGDFTINPGGTGAVSSWFHRRDEGPAEAIIFNQNATALRVS